MRALCIYCPEISGEKEKAKAHFDSVGLDVQFIRGIYGVDSGLVTTLTYEFDHPGSGYVYGPKTVGLCLSHVVMWSICEFLPDDYFLLLESDAKFDADWKKNIEQSLIDVPTDWDMLYVGSCNCEGKTMAHVKGDVYRVDNTNVHEMPHCTHAIVVRKKAIPILLDTQRKFYAPIDIALIFDSLQYLNTYVVLPRIVDQFDTAICP